MYGLNKKNTFETRTDSIYDCKPISHLKVKYMSRSKEHRWVYRSLVWLMRLSLNGSKSSQWAITDHGFQNDMFMRPSLLLNLRSWLHSKTALNKVYQTFSSIWNKRICRNVFFGCPDPPPRREWTLNKYYWESDQHRLFSELRKQPCSGTQNSLTHSIR